VTALRRQAPALLVVAVAILAAAASLGNGFAYDDVPIVAENAGLRALRHLPSLLGRPYWPDDGAGLMWRPVATIGFAVQWLAGGGRPLVFHLVNVALIAACALAVLAMARRVLSPMRALAAALLFACLPVHTEVTGNVVGQAELWCTLWLVLAVHRWLALEETPDRGSVAVVALCTALAAMSKEQGFTAPAVLVIAEFLRPSGPRGWRRVAGDLALPVAMLVALLAGRLLLLEGLGGGPAAAPIRGLGLVERSIVMLGVLPRIVGALVWPTRLLADYNPGDVTISTSMGPAQWLGLGLLLAAVGLAASVPTRRHALAMLAAALVTFAPAANVLVPTGVVFAERHLFLPSAFLVLLPALLVPHIEVQALRVAAQVLLGVVVVLGTARSALRLPDWKDSSTLFAATVRDAPTNYRGLMMHATTVLGEGRADSAEALLRRSVSLFDGDARAWDDLGQLVRRRAGCDEAVPYFTRALVLQPGRESAQARLRVCLRRPGGRPVTTRP
jgi:hypothetical protein